MQVHKETIDKVPNSLPNRSNVDIEIYGMEGIPAADLKEHERQKQSSRGSNDSSDEDEPANKRPKPEGLLGNAPPNIHGAMPPGMVPPGMMPPPPGMPPGMPMMSMGHMGFMHPGMPHMMPPHMMMQGQGGPPKPLFPSAVVPSSSPGAGVVGADFKPISSGATISAPPTTNPASGSGDTTKINTIASTGASSKIIHPLEDISLEEIRARHSKYSKGAVWSKEDDRRSSASSAASELAIAVSAAHQAAVVSQAAAIQAKAQEAQQHMVMMGRMASAAAAAAAYPVRVSGPPLAVVTGAPVMHTGPTMGMLRGPLIGGPLMRPPPIGMPPGR